MKFLAATSAAGALAGLAVLATLVATARAECETITTAAEDDATFDLETYAASRWYVQQQQPTAYLPPSNNYCVFAEYTVVDESDVSVFNYANQDEVNGEPQIGELCATVADASVTSELMVGVCDLPQITYGPYYVVAVGNLTSDGHYPWAVVSGGQPTHELDDGCTTGLGVNNAGLWIFTHDAEDVADEVAEARQAAMDKGFSLDLLQDVEQHGCTYEYDEEDLDVGRESQKKHRGPIITPRMTDQETVAELDVAAYMGRWFQVYADAFVMNSFEKNAVCVTADYDYVETNNSISVHNGQFDTTPDGKYEYIDGTAVQPDPSDPGKLQVYFYFDAPPFPAPYWVFALGPVNSEGLYDWAIVADNLCPNGGLYVLARDVDTFYAEYNDEVLAECTALGFDKMYNTPIPTAQDDCTYEPSPF